MPYPVTAEVSMKQPGTNDVYTVSEGGQTRARALARIVDQVKAMVGTVIPGSLVYKEAMTAGVVATMVPHAATQYEDATLRLEKVVGGVVVDSATVDIKNMSLAYADPNVPGKVLIGAPGTDLRKIGNDYYDELGNNGFETVDGWWVEANGNRR